jgi:hypothetical protein
MLSIFSGFLRIPRKLSTFHITALFLYYILFLKPVQSAKNAPINPIIAPPAINPEENMVPFSSLASSCSGSFLL